MLRVMLVFGTRPEAIKMAPIIRAAQSAGAGIDAVTCVTGQHRQMLDQVLGVFGIRPDLDLNLMTENQTLASLTEQAVGRVSEVVRGVRPDLLLVQGDTTTAMAAALAAFYAQVAVGHVEAGLRTGRRYRPFPEEINRRLISVLASLHFAPTVTAAAALRAEGIPDTDVHVTGNTVVDALEYAVRVAPVGVRPYIQEGGQRLILVTAHRRENFGPPLDEICHALLDLARRPDVTIVYPVHLNPNVQGPVRRWLADHPRIHLLPPQDYLGFVRLLRDCDLVLTDSGGIQEEAPALGKPVLVLRDETERPEAVAAGTVLVVGTDRERIVRETERLLDEPAAYRAMAHAVSPYGDGHAAERIIRIISSASGHARPSLTPEVAASHGVRSF
jgi:UDP-N-acetylglucosamine 2-epimerase (non-hydrolysing)